ncbi:MAG: ABC transporter ATP-binding protein [Verrucomicrobiales bacterium]|nr:ABC transporter ATP-binding protein [Verrucomicrobiales bacterium]
MITASHLIHYYSVHPVLRDVSIEVNEGELVVLMGANGCGKSTLLGVMAGFLCPLEGQIKIDGVQRRSSVDAELAIRKKIAYLPDHPWLPSLKTGREFLMAVGQVYDLPTLQVMEHMQRLLALFHLTDKGDSLIKSYSNGQKKKIAIAATLITEAPILLLDEPFTGGLDPSAILALKTLLKKLGERKDVTVVMASQLPEIAAHIADRIAVIRDGQILHYDTVKQLIAHQSSDNLESALEQILNPETEDLMQAYFHRKN